MHTVIAYKISKDPSLLEKARKKLTDMRSRHDPDNMPLYIQEWEQVLTLHWEHIAALLIAVTEEAILPRHCSPFVGILTEEERLKIIEPFRL